MFDITIPFSPTRALGAAYNDAMERSNKDFVLLLDHDVLLGLTGKWYDLCMNVISNHDFDVATCWCNQGGSAHRGVISLPEYSSPEMKHQMMVAERIWSEHGYSVTPINCLTGFFMLVNKKSWKEMGGFPEEPCISGIDQDYMRRLNDESRTILRINGLYVYHNKSRSWTP